MCMFLVPQFLFLIPKKKKKLKRIFSGRRMASLKIPANVPLPEEDSEQLHRAFKGFPLISLH